MKLTEEQVAAVDLFRSASSLKISAFAGTGKTTTLTALGNATSNSGIYLAFNRNIADEARKKFPQSVDCRTTHSLALRYLPSPYRADPDKLYGALQGNRVAKLLDIEAIAVKDVLLKPRTLGYLTARTIQRFCQSAEEDVRQHHVPLSGKLVSLSDSDKSEIKKYLAALAAHLWDRMVDPTDPAPLGHDGYLKYWSLMCPSLEYDFILLDEAQDTNEAVLSVLRKQGAQLTLVGDRHQQIYAWRGAVNAMANVDTAAESRLTQSFRFGPQIAEVATRLLSELGETSTLRGNSTIKSHVTTTGRAPTVLCRTNAGVIATVLESLNSRERPHVVGGVSDLIRMLEDVTRLRREIPAESPELFGFEDWVEVTAFAETEEGASLRTFVNIVNSNGEIQLISALRRVAQDETSADVIVSTGHRSKGREWPAVKLHGDFVPKTPAQKETGERKLNDGEARLLYVAVTRPQGKLIVPAAIASSWSLSTIGEGTVHTCASSNAASAPYGATVAPRTPRPRPGLPAIAKVVGR